MRSTGRTAGVKRWDGLFVMRNAQDDKIIVRKKPEPGNGFTARRATTAIRVDPRFLAKAHRPQYRRSAQTAPGLVGHVGPFPAGCAVGSCDGEGSRSSRKPLPANAKCSRASALNSRFDHLEQSGSRSTCCSGHPHPIVAGREEAWAALRAGYGFDAQALGTRMRPRVPQTHSLDCGSFLKYEDQ